MEINSISYSSESNNSVIEVSTSEIITDDIVKSGPTYKVSLTGNYDFATPSLYDDVIAKLQAAGINLMPF